MTRTMYDGTDSDAAAIGRQAKPGDLAAGYVDGEFAWSDTEWSAIKPGVIRVRIAVFASTNDGHVLDCEPGNTTPAKCVDWVLMRRKAGIDPTVYCNQTDKQVGWPAVRAAFQARGVPEPHYWVANYDGIPQIPDGAIAKQYNDDIHLGTHWDISVVADHWPGIDPPRLTDPLAAALRRNHMHADLELNKPVILTNPAAVLGGTTQLLLAADFGDATVRVALFSFKTGTWTVTDHAIARTSGATKIPLPADINKASIKQTAGTGTVGLDLLA